MSNGTIDWTLGLKVKITTLLDNTITGTIYAFCHTTNTITLIEDIVQNEPGRRNLNDGSPSRSLKGSEKPPTPNYRIIKTSFVKEATVLSKPKKTPGHPSATSTYKDVFAKAEPSIGKVNIAKLVAKADKAVQAELKRRARIGVGVTKEAQALFDLLSKTYVISTVMFLPFGLFINVFYI